MCGIAGIVHWNKKPVIKNDLVKMNSYLKERGPDHQGYWIDDNIGFAHSRLSIIDLSPLGNQPMSDKDGVVHITYNGEIYNYKELKLELVNRGVNFKSNSDTEVLIYGFLEWGMDILLKKTNGMFAFSIWDTRDNSCYFARDRFGQKPLYYFQSEKELIFSSDIRSIWSLKRGGLKLDYDSLDYYLSELSTPQPKTIWKDIKQVKPSHYYKFQNGKKVAEQKYWQLDYSYKIDISFEEAVEETERLLTQAILKRTISDVPIGAFLSGGVDSGLVCSLLAKNTSKPINSFSVGLSDNTEMNELPEARIVAKRYNTNHTEIIAKPKLADGFSRIINYMGEPFADSSLIPSDLICYNISKNIKVALSGDGGDEIFGGYYDYLWAYKSDLLNQCNTLTSRTKYFIIKLLNRVKKEKSDFPIIYDYSKIKGGGRLFRNMGFNTQQKSLLYNSMKINSGFTKSLFNNTWQENHFSYISDSLFSASLKTRLLNDYLVKVDRSSMINSLEVRSPFLDKDLVEFSAKIPLEYKFNAKKPKSILKEIAKKHIDFNIDKRKKRGFGIPLHEWIKKDLKIKIKERILDKSSFCNNLFDEKYCVKLFNDHISGKKNHVHRIWALYCLEEWQKSYY